MKTRAFAALAALARRPRGRLRRLERRRQQQRRRGRRASKALVVLVTDVNQLNDHGFNQLAYQGLLKAQRELGIRGAVYQSRLGAGVHPEPLDRRRARRPTSSSPSASTRPTRSRRSRSSFPTRSSRSSTSTNGDLAGKPKNVEGLIFKEQEVGYLAGYLAGLVEKQSGGTNTIGSVGGQKQPPVDRYIAGYQAGAKKADPGIKLLNAYSNDWVDQAKCKRRR